MLTLDEIVALAASGESETLEFKKTTGRATRRTGAARGDAGRVAVGQQVSERTIEHLSAELQQIDPPAFRRSNGSAWMATVR